MEITAPAGDPLQLLLEELDVLSRKTGRYKSGASKTRLKPRLPAPVFRQLSAQGHWLLFFCGGRHCERSGLMNFGLGPCSP
jgi:hypothetical protein